MDDNRSLHAGRAQPANPVERAVVRRGFPGRQKAVNDNAPSLAWRVFRVMRWAVILVVVGAIAWSLAH